MNRAYSRGYHAERVKCHKLGLAEDKCAAWVYA